MGKSGSKIKGTNLGFDPEFRFLLSLDPDLEEWRAFAAEWWSTIKPSDHKQTGITAFFAIYLRGLGLKMTPVQFLDANTPLPELWQTLQLDSVGYGFAKTLYNAVTDFVDWVLREKFATADANGNRVIPSHLRNPFQRKSIRESGKSTDLSFRHLLLVETRLNAWQIYAAEYIQTVRNGQGHHLKSLNAFFLRYLVHEGLPLDPLTFLRRATPKPALIEAILATKGRINAQNTDTSGKPTPNEIKLNTHVANFIDWVLVEKLSVQGDHGERIVPHEYHNPIERLSRSGTGIPNETVKNALPMLYIRMLREMLAEGKNFRDWTWAQSAIANNSGSGAWFVVDPAIVNRDDPDCVWRERKTKWYQRKKGLPEIVTELWSPVRAVGLYVKLELPLRSNQVRFLDSGEGDTWRYVWDALVDGLN